MKLDAEVKAEVRERLGGFYMPSVQAEEDFMQPAILEDPRCIEMTPDMPEFDYNRDIVGQLCTKMDRKNRNMKKYQANILEKQLEIDKGRQDNQTKDIPSRHLQGGHFMKPDKKHILRRQNDSQSYREFEQILDNIEYEQQQERELDQLPSPDYVTRACIKRRPYMQPKRINLNDL